MTKYDWIRQQQIMMYPRKDSYFAGEGKKQGKQLVEFKTIPFQPANT